MNTSEKIRISIITLDDNSQPHSTGSNERILGNTLWTPNKLIISYNQYCSLDPVTIERTFADTRTTNKTSWAAEDRVNLFYSVSYLVILTVIEFASLTSSELSVNLVNTNILTTIIDMNNVSLKNCTFFGW